MYLCFPMPRWSPSYAIIIAANIWKTLCLTISMTICLVTIAVIFFLLLYSLF